MPELGGLIERGLARMNGVALSLGVLPLGQPYWVRYAWTLQVLGATCSTFT